MKIVGFVGFQGSGKDTASFPLLEAGYKKTSFAGKLKDCCATIFGWDRSMLEGTDPESRLKREETDLWWAEKLKKPGFSPRRAFQTIGTDTIRSNFNENIWVYAVERQLTQEGGNWVITDCRFPNEIQMLKDLGATIIRVKRGEDPDWYDIAKMANTLPQDSDEAVVQAKAVQYLNDKRIHISEWAWIGYPFDHELLNDCSAEELHERVRKLCL
jgi:hypothetical protein